MSDASDDIESATEQILDTLGADLDDPDFEETPRRVAGAFEEMCVRCFEDDKEHFDQLLSTTFPAEHSNLVTKKDTQAFSMCPHHLLPVEYHVDFAYLPNDQVVGLSKIPRLIKYAAKKPQKQEDYTEEIVELFTDEVDPKAAAVVVEGEHSCMTKRGVKSEGTMVTSAIRGQAMDSANVLQEFLELRQ